jgi:hypothetical protein
MTTISDIASAQAATTAIDSTFPVAGQDNNSQGFRDNFSYIQTGLDNIVSVITTLNTDTAKTSEDNDFNGVKIANAETNMLYGTVLGAGTISAPEFIDVRDAEYFTYTFDANLTLTFSNWPVSDRFAKVRVDVKTDGSARTVNFATTSGTVITDAATTLPLTMTTVTTDRHIFDAWTTNGGNTVFVKYLGLFN